MTKWVYAFGEVADAEKYTGSWDGVRGLLGGKGANLAEMARIGVPVPPGFTITTEACNAYLAEGGSFPAGMWDEALTALHAVETETGKTFGDADNPLLVSCRSGAKFSMPGMMDTVLNIGLNDEVVEGVASLSGDKRFAYDSYRRLIQMFGTVVLGVSDEPFEEVLARYRKQFGVANDAELPPEALADVVKEFKGIFKDESGIDFPQDPYEQLELATEAVFKSWNSPRAFAYRKAAHIADDLGTAVNIVTMVFGNMGNDSATGVAMSRNATTGEKQIEGDYLVNAQGEDVVAGIRVTDPVQKLADDMPAIWEQFTDIATKLEEHYRNMQDMEFTIERGKLWLLQTRDGKRTAQAAVFLHPQFDTDSRATAVDAGSLVAKGLNVSPGAAVGVVAFDADLAQKWATDEGKEVIMVRPETKPDDVHGMLAAKGILTSRGGRTSHAALVARQFGKPAVVGVSELEIDMDARTMSVAGKTINQGDWMSIDGTTGDVFVGHLDTKVPDISDPSLMKLLGWADKIRRLQVWTNADYPRDAERARSYGAQGIGLCRTEHMFFEPERLPHVQQMIMAETPEEREGPLSILLPFQREDFAGLFRAMDGLPVIIRLIDPPLHEFLPSHEDLMADIDELRAKGGSAADIAEKERMLERSEALRETNPMLGLRGVRLGIELPELTRMQVRAIFEAAIQVKNEGVDPHPEVMIPLTSHVNELKRQREVLEAEAKKVMEEQGMQVDYKFGTMIEIPRAALTADQMAEYAEFFSFGTNDLTQTTFGISRDDAETGFLIDYLGQGILPANPFASLDEDGVGKLMGIGVEAGRSTRSDLEVGICGEHGGDPSSIDLCHRLNLDYVSCSPFRVPVARLAAAHAAIRNA
jgi:pyruvate,orthophosphate dikinase